MTNDATVVFYASSLAVTSCACDVFSRICCCVLLSVCLSVMFYVLKPWLRKFILCRYIITIFRSRSRQEKKHEISSHHPSVGSVSLQMQWQQVHFCLPPWHHADMCRLKIADPQPSSQTCTLQRDSIMTEHVCLSCLWVVHLWIQQYCSYFSLKITATVNSVYDLNNSTLSFLCLLWILCLANVDVARVDVIWLQPMWFVADVILHREEQTCLYRA